MDLQGPSTSAPSFSARIESFAWTDDHQETTSPAPHAGCKHLITVLAQPHLASRGAMQLLQPPLALQEAQVSCILTHLPPVSIIQPVLLLANSSHRLEQETWECHHKKLPEWNPTPWDPDVTSPFLIAFHFIIGFHCLESLAFSTEHVVLAPISLLQPFTPWPCWRF